MLELTVVPPMPGPGQVPVLAQLVQRHIGIAQDQRAGRTAVVAGCNQLVVHLQRPLRHVQRDRVAVLAWKAGQRRHQPFQQLACPGVHHHG